jgi:hypothetical protein
MDRRRAGGPPTSGLAQKCFWFGVPKNQQAEVDSPMYTYLLKHNGDEIVEFVSGACAILA